MTWSKPEYQLWDEIFPGTTLHEFINCGHAKTVCWFCQYKGLHISEEAWQAIRTKVDRNTWANGYRKSRHFTNV